MADEAAAAPAGPPPDPDGGGPGPGDDRGGQQGPTQEPTQEPTEQPTQEPTQEPTEQPTQEPTEQPTEQPTQEPTQEPTEQPTQEPGQEGQGQGSGQGTGQGQAPRVVGDQDGDGRSDNPGGPGQGDDDAPPRLSTASPEALRAIDSEQQRAAESAAAAGRGAEGAGTNFRNGLGGPTGPPLQNRNDGARDGANANGQGRRDLQPAIVGSANAAEEGQRRVDALDAEKRSLQAGAGSITDPAQQQLANQRIQDVDNQINTIRGDVANQIRQQPWPAPAPPAPEPPTGGQIAAAGAAGAAGADAARGLKADGLGIAGKYHDTVGGFMRNHPHIAGIPRGESPFQTMQRGASHLRTGAELADRASHLRGLGSALKVGGAAGAAFAPLGVASDMNWGRPGGESWQQAVTSNAVGLGTSVASGAAIGGAIGTAIPIPVVGTLVGAGIGAVAGGAIGAFTSGATDYAFEDKDGFQVGDIGRAAGNGLRDVGGMFGIS